MSVEKSVYLTHSKTIEAFVEKELSISAIENLHRPLIRG